MGELKNMEPLLSSINNRLHSQNELANSLLDSIQKKLDALYNNNPEILAGIPKDSTVLRENMLTNLEDGLSGYAGIIKRLHSALDHLTKII